MSSLHQITNQPYCWMMFKCTVDLFNILSPIFTLYPWKAIQELFYVEQTIWITALVLCTDNPVPSQLYTKCHKTVGTLYQSCHIMILQFLQQIAILAIISGRRCHIQYLMLIIATCLESCHNSEQPLVQMLNWFVETPVL